MRRFSKLMLLVLGYGLLAVVISSLPNHPKAAAAADPPGLPVNVTNTPLPVNVNNAPTVNAKQSGAWSVGVNNLPATQTVSGTVAVNNFPAFPSTLTGATVPVSGSLTANVTFPPSQPVTMPTHLGQPPANLVQLVCYVASGGACIDWWRVFRNGGAPVDCALNLSTCWPAGYALVVTDVDVTVGPLPPGGAGSWGLWDNTGALTILSEQVIATSSGSFYYTSHRSLTTGVILPPSTFNALAYNSGPLISGPALTLATIEGYLVPTSP